MNKENWQQGELKNFPLEVIAKMLERQIKQGHGDNLKILQDYKQSGDGFTWEYTVEGHDFWNKVIDEEDFEVFFEKYPKTKIYELW